MTSPIDMYIHEIIDRETTAWNEKSVELLMSIFHPDMVWVWPIDSGNLDPLSWSPVMGKFNLSRWTKEYVDWFAHYDIIHNDRITQKITISKDGDGAFAVVDIDTLWRSSSGETSHWRGRTGKTYVQINNEWKMINQVGVFDIKAFQPHS